MPDSAAFEYSDLTRPSARRRALVWIAVCVAFVVGLVGSAANSGDWYLLLIAFVFVGLGARTARRLVRSRTAA